MSVLSLYGIQTPPGEEKGEKVLGGPPECIPGMPPPFRGKITRTPLFAGNEPQSDPPPGKYWGAYHETGLVGDSLEIPKTPGKCSRPVPMLSANLHGGAGRRGYPLTAPPLGPENKHKNSWHLQHLLPHSCIYLFGHTSWQLEEGYSNQQ